MITHAVTSVMPSAVAHCRKPFVGARALCPAARMPGPRPTRAWARASSGRLLWNLEAVFLLAKPLS